MSPVKKTTKKKSRRPVRKKTGTAQNASPPLPTKDVDSESADEHQDSSEEGLESNVNAGSDRAGKGVSTVVVDELKSTPENQFLMSLAAQLTASEMQAKRQEELIGGALRVILQMFAEMLKLNLSQAGTDTKYVERVKQKIESSPFFRNSHQIFLTRPPYSNHEHRELLLSFYRLAKDIHLNAHEKAPEVYAEQIFEVEEKCTKEKIAKRFNEYGWTELKGKESIVKLRGRVESWFKELLNNWYAFPYPNRNQIAKKSLAYLGNAAHVCAKLNEHFPMKKSFLNEVANSIQSIVDSCQQDLSQWAKAPPPQERDYPYERFDDQMLINFMFCREKPTGVQRWNSDEKTKFYRPYAIFRYLRLYGEFSSRPQSIETKRDRWINHMINDAKELNKKLRIPASELKQTPYPLIPGDQKMYIVERLFMPDEFEREDDPNLTDM